MRENKPKHATRRKIEPPTNQLFEVFELPGSFSSTLQVHSTKSFDHILGSPFKLAEELLNLR